MSFLVKFDEELIQRMASRVAREATSLCFGPFGEAPPTIYTNKQAYDLRLTAPGETPDESYKKLTAIVLGLDKRSADDVWYGHENVVAIEDGGSEAEDGGGFIDGRTVVGIVIAVVIVALSRRPRRIAAGRQPMIRFPKLTPAQRELLKLAGLRALQKARQGVKLLGAWAVGYFQEKAFEAAFAMAWKMRGGKSPTLAAWMTIYHGMNHLIVPIMLDELSKNALPQTPSYPRSASKTKLTRIGRKKKGPAVRLELPTET